MSDRADKVEGRRGKAVVVRGNDIDTDRIIPARYMKSITFAGLEDSVFIDARFTPDGTEKDHPFNEKRFQSASILVVNKNFGCGSSREHAPQALMRWGIRAIVGESFAEIFFGNCVALGIPAVSASEDDVAALMDSIELDPGQEIHVDLVAGTVSSRAGVAPVHMPDGPRRQLLEGTWDAVRNLLAARDQVAATADRLPYIKGF
jgi:3-isopropylmalate/(R)-2-methylmalate dehydratase small subunit